MRLAVGGVVLLSAASVWWLVATAPSPTGGASSTTPATASTQFAGVSSRPSDGPRTTAAVDAPPILGEAPPLVDIESWLQSDLTSLEQLKGKVVVVQFWTFACRNCRNTIPHLQELAAAHADEPFEIVGIHAPEFEFERDTAAVQQAADELGVTWPIALDTERHTFREWQGSPAFWPRTYVLDVDGNIRFDHIGEGAYDELAAAVAWLLDQR